MRDCWVQLFPRLEEQGFQGTPSLLPVCPVRPRYPAGSCADPEIMVSSQAASLYITVPSALAAFIGTRAVSFISGSREERKILP